MASTRSLRKLTADTGGKPLPGSARTASRSAPQRSADGATRLLVNSHQPYTGPVAWYEAVLQIDEGWHVAGGFFPGSPFMLHGHNEHLGWANTVNEPDLVDIYRLTINPANDNQYRLDGKWRDFEKSDAAIRVKLFGPLFWTVHRDVLFSAHGPVFKTDHGVFAIRYAGMNEVRQVAAVLPPQQGARPRRMESRDAAAGAAQHQLHLRRREGQHRLCLQRPVPGAEGGHQLAGLSCPATAPI